jgi:hypothetical protein
MRLLLCLLLLPALASAEIYRWTDEQGRVHFGQRPAAGAQAQQVEVKPQIIERDEQTREREERAARFYKARQAEQEQTRIQASEFRAERNAQCERLRQALSDIAPGQRYYQTMIDGSRHYYSDAELDTARQQLRDQLSEHCS